MISALKKKLALYRKNRLVDSLAALSDEDAREVVRFARKNMHLHTDPKGRRKGALDEWAKAMVTEIEKEESHAE